MGVLLSIYGRTALRLMRRPPHLRVFWNCLSYALFRLARRSLVRHTPISAVIYTTHSCNLNCSFCFIGDELNPPHPTKYELTLDQFRKLCQTPMLKRALRVGLLGGEPFLAREIFEILEELKRQRKVSTVVTNATLLKGPKLERFVNCAPTILGISLYETNREDVVRVYHALKHCTVIWIQTVVDATNLEQMDEFIRFCLALGCNNLRMGNYYPTNGIGLDKVIFDDNKEYPRVRARLMRIYKGKINIDWPNPIARQVRHKSCLQPFNYVHLNNQGHMGGCFLRPPNEGRYGNVFSPDSWNAPVYQALRSNMLDVDVTPDSLCRYCENLTSDLYKI